MTRKYLLLLLALAGVALIVLMYARRPNGHAPTQAERASPAKQEPVSAGYADPGACAVCHGEIARTYSLTGMARSFSRLEKGSGVIFARRTDENYTRPLFHEASDRHYTMVERGGKFYQRRHQIGFDGKETNAIDVEADYVIGSGNHARTFLHRNPDGRLTQLPVSWYAERGGYWAMSPGYDRFAHLDFRRVVDAGCMSCHNGYPGTPVADDGNGPRFGPPSLAGSQPSSGAAGYSLPEGIDCQRCHGPGQPHIDAIKAGDLESARRVIVNPATLDRDRQLETCMQCHLEPTSSRLPFQIRRYERPPFSYIPGKPLGDDVIYFDHAPGTGRDDKFEIAGDAYRLRKSACFQQSQMTCVTCHNPHDIPRGAKAVDHYVAVCQSCHERPHPRGAPQLPRVRAGATCIDCHMPKRRTDDAVHVVMTDHYIQRQTVLRNLLSDRTEADSFKDGDYRGEVVLYYPPNLPATPENALYLAIAQVQHGSNLKTGIPRLEDAIAKYRPERAEPYYELARAYSMTSNYDAAIRWCREALRRDANFLPALKALGAAATAKGDLIEAAQALEKAVMLSPRDGNALADLGNVYLRQGRVDEAQKILERALALDASLPRAHNLMGLALLKKGSAAAAETHFRDAIRLQPDLAEAHNNLGNLLASRRAYGEAGFHFAEAIASNPNYVEAHHSYGVILALTKAYAKAIAELETAIRLAPDLLPAHLDLAEVLVAMGRRGEARAHFEAAARSADAEVREAALAALRAR